MKTVLILIGLVTVISIPEFMKNSVRQDLHSNADKTENLYKKMLIVDRWTQDKEEIYIDQQKQLNQAQQFVDDFTQFWIFYEGIFTGITDRAWKHFVFNADLVETLF